MVIIMPQNPVDVICVPRTDIPFGWRFYCPFCKVYHLHGTGLGHRVAHCIGNTPFSKYGYVLTEIISCPACGDQVVRRSDNDRNCITCGQFVKRIENVPFKGSDDKWLIQ